MTENLSVEIRPARGDDAAPIVAIYNDAVARTVATFDTEPRSLDRQRQWLAEHRPPWIALVAEASGTVVGWASLSPWSDRPAYARTAEVSVYVAAPTRGRGVGSALLTALVAGAEREGLHTLLARVADRNPPSLRLHAAHGFTVAGEMREVGWKFGRWIDVTLLQRMSGRPSGPSDGARLSRTPRPTPSG